METSPETQQKFDELMKLEKIEHHHLGILTADEKTLFLQTVHAKIPTLSGEEFDNYVEQTKSLLDQEEIWEFNHSKIAVLVERYVIKNGTIPSVASIAYDTKLSRKTVSRHLNAYTGSTALKDKKNAMAIVMMQVMGKVSQKALAGDLKAARLYYDIVSTPQKPESPTNKQNNYIQINNTQLNQQIIQLLEPEQLTQIEQIISQAVLKIKP